MFSVQHIGAVNAHLLKCVSSHLFSAKLANRFRWPLPAQVHVHSRASVRHFSSRKSSADESTQNEVTESSSEQPNEQSGINTHATFANFANNLQTPKQLVTYANPPELAPMLFSQITNQSYRHLFDGQLQHRQTDSVQLSHRVGMSYASAEPPINRPSYGEWLRLLISTANCHILQAN